VSGGVTVTDVTVGGAPLELTVINNYPHSTAANLVVTKDLLGFYGDWGVTDATKFSIRVYDTREKGYLWFIEGTDSGQPQAQAGGAGGVYWCVGNASGGFSEAVDRAKAVYTELPLTADTSLTLQNLWADSDGWRYRIEEVITAAETGRYDNGGSTVVTLYKDSGNAAIDNSNVHTAIRNMFRQSPGNLVITKRIAGSPSDWGVGADTPFQARVREAGGAQRYLVFDANNRYTGFDTSGSVVTFSRSVPAVLTGIPSGSYVVEENLPPGGTTYYAVTYEGDGVSANGEVDLQSDGPSKTVTVVNTYQHDIGRVIINKSLSGNFVSRGVDGTTLFGVQLYDADEQENLLYFVPVERALNLYRCVGSAADGITDAAYQGMAIDNSTVFDTMPLSANSPVIVDDLWVDNTYRVKEIGGAHYTVKYTDNDQQLPQDGTNATGNINIIAINTYSGDDSGVDDDPPGGGGNPPGVGGNPPGGSGNPPQSPRTGDYSAMTLWLVLLLISVLGITVLYRCGIKRKKIRTSAGKTR
jgi:hypothetical protein